MRRINSGLRVVKAAIATSLCVASVTPAAANAAVRPSVKPVAPVAFNAGKACEAKDKACKSLIASRAGASVAESGNGIIGLALLPLLGIAAAVTLAAVVAATAGDEDEPASPGS